MLKLMHFLLMILACSAMFTSVQAAGKRPVDSWNYYHFDGNVFVPGSGNGGKAYLAVMDKMMPRILKASAPTTEQQHLPDDNGGVAGICYLQSTGGKLGLTAAASSRSARSNLVISSGGRKYAVVETDDDGFFALALPAGLYSISGGSVASDITVTEGKTTLTAVRTGKRVVD
ncbi:MAG: hypothetical protein PHN84_06640 [Desulfuromonadaceae bacterium]|nr:hypothetical protein [Desulfuromonadaceae bacterium]MDD2856178.1 hypothetical protein [Desulfuromonadaceae bacterium]